MATTKVQSMRVRDIMSKEVVYVDSADSVQDALDLMAENRVAALPVVDGKLHCIGMLSTSDLVDVARDLSDDLLHLDELSSLTGGWLINKLGQDFGEKRLQDLMSIDVETIVQEATIGKAAQEMLRHQVHRLPVVDDHDRLIGIVSTMDILEVVAEGALID